MTVTQDSLHHAPPQVEPIAGEELQTETPAVVERVQPARPRTPYQVLQQLPPGATPAQQDSAIQAAFQPENLHLSDRPDTLYLPGHERGRSIKDAADIPQYYRESYFATDSLLHPEIEGGRYGIAGDPRPYAARNDNVITGLLLACFVLAMVAFAQCRGFLARQAKDFFFVRHSDNTTTITETTGEFRFQFFLVFQTCLLLALVTFFYTLDRVADTFIIQQQYQLVGIFTGCFIVYFLVKAALYSIVNEVFFDHRQNEQWLKSQLFIIAMMGVVLFPLVMLQCYFNLPVESALIYVGIVVVLVKISTIFKSYAIFFRQNGIVLQIILYFCALEIVPLLSLAGVLVLIVDYLKINF